MNYVQRLSCPAFAPSITTGRWPSHPPRLPKKQEPSDFQRLSCEVYWVPVSFLLGWNSMSSVTSRGWKSLTWHANLVTLQTPCPNLRKLLVYTSQSNRDFQESKVVVRKAFLLLHWLISALRTCAGHSIRCRVNTSLDPHRRLLLGCCCFPVILLFYIQTCGTATGTYVRWSWSTSV